MYKYNSRSREVAILKILLHRAQYQALRDGIFFCSFTIHIILSGATWSKSTFTNDIPRTVLTQYNDLVDTVGSTSNFTAVAESAIDEVCTYSS